MNELPKPTKKAFHDLCILHNFHYAAQKVLAKAAGVHKDIVQNMFLSNAVHRAEALLVLEAFSDAIDETYTLENVEVALLPTLADLRTTYQFDLDALAAGAGVPFATVDMMLTGQKVTTRDARFVLQEVSHQSHEHWDLENVDVPVIDEEQESHE